MTNKDAIWQQILANPRDEELRLIYADVLEELGEIEQATKIREQDTINQLTFLTGSDVILVDYFWRGFISVIEVEFKRSVFNMIRNEVKRLPICQIILRTAGHPNQEQCNEDIEILKGKYPKVEFTKISYWTPIPAPRFLRPCKQ